MTSTRPDLDVIVTFVKYRGEILAFFRATRLPSEVDWVREKPHVRTCGNASVCVQDCYAHIGQHCDAALSILQNSERATPAEYAPLKREMRSLGYRVFTHQTGRLALSRYRTRQPQE